MEKRFKESQRVAVMGIAGNLILSIIKITAGTTYKSQALIADGANSIGDIINSAITYLGNKVASQPRDSDHNYGHGKAEAVATQVIGLMLCFIAFEVFSNSLSVFTSKASEIQFSLNMIAISVFAIVTKIFMYLYSINIGRKHSNPLVLANAADHIADVFVTLGSISGIIFTHLGIWWMDPVIGMIISIWILIQGIGISRNAIRILMDSSIDAKILNNLKETIAIIPGVEDVQKVTTHSMGIGYSVEVRIGVNCTLTVAEGHNIASRVKSKLINTAEIGDVIVHINPVSDVDCDYKCLKENTADCKKNNK
ncbi:ferrous-iron efflux pump FieF [Oxobacter pfennigii]|uniref:Ferrous-iron efflux pump FieF n=1 Tax=Oxobacter pfennigii TaxID=36849 RepID=A0A0P8WEU7_9CLOT|nr:cation diffusion facilitator family transporter [Oxobacter pfennigii]KPU46281.1 ferrous-iron efflux pump FieF [Oxobacter pfennigii]